MHLFNVFAVTTLFVAASYAAQGPATPVPKIIVKKIQIVHDNQTLKQQGEHPQVAPKSKIGAKMIVKKIQISRDGIKEKEEEEKKKKQEEVEIDQEEEEEMKKEEEERMKIEDLIDDEDQLYEEDLLNAEYEDLLNEK